MQSETQQSVQLYPPRAEETGIISEVILEFSENIEMTEGMCSCVCINDERCCGCLIQ